MKPLLGTTYKALKLHRLRPASKNVFADYETKCGHSGRKVRPGEHDLPRCAVCFGGVD